MPPISNLDHAKEVITIEMEALAHVRDRLGQAFAEAVELMAASPGRVAVTGIGKSGLIGRKIAATLSSTGTPAYFLHPVEGMHGDLGVLRPQDLVIAISYSGKTDELLAILPAIHNLGVRIIAITSGLESPLAKLADLVIDAGVPREACSFNMVPTSSTTAALALGDALAICLMDSKAFTSRDFSRYHPGGSLGQRLSLSVTDLMHRENLPLARPDWTLRQTLRILDTSGFGAALVVDGQKHLLGVITDGDIRRLLCGEKTDLDQPASTVMKPGPHFALVTMRATELLDIMEQKSITILPVVDEDRIVHGLVHLHDLLGKGQLRFFAPFGVVL
jgi:arabinose-5-phosphate isomerase